MRYRQMKRTIWIFSPTTPHPGSHHDSPRSCAGALWKGQFGFTWQGGAFPSPAPSPGRYPLGPVYGMMREEGIIGFASPGPAFSGICGRRRVRWGRAVYGKMLVENSILSQLPPTASLPGSHHENPEGRGERCMAKCRLKVHSGLAHRAGLSRDIACTGFAPLAGESTGSVPGRFA